MAKLKQLLGEVFEDTPKINKHEERCKLVNQICENKEENKGDKNQIPTLSSLVNFFNITGAPSLTVPCGFTSKGMPVGMQIAASEFNDSLVLRVAQAYENATEWHMRQPSML